MITRLPSKAKQESSVDSPQDRMRRRLLSLAVIAGAAACLPRRAWAQSAEMSGFQRTLRSLKIWWNSLTREPDEGDIEAQDLDQHLANGGLIFD